jgi:hypothetical protein
MVWADFQASAHDALQVRAKEPFTPEMLREVEQYYFGE